ncbi:MAG: tRNA (adenosine(37)-N6)-threonylcarbamoyltransferase complex ATPase subunit type 1 TsaE [Desulfamplus sp.]|nr:tRNA (adenosine(37)-N6)-threonylcarbamoyltransferase complex ATPase subunit type 1 TsaE [Desulfamplus sp.]
MEITIKTDSGDTTSEVGRKLGSLISSNINSNNTALDKIAIALYGGLGAGKTTFVQGFARGLGVPENYYITSPTYNIINEYPAIIPSNITTDSIINKNIGNQIDTLKKQVQYLDTLTLYHLDLYRIGSPDELEYIGFDDVVASDKSVIIVEWADIIDSYHKNIIKFDIEIRIEIDKDFNRVISFIPYGLDSLNLLNQFAV